jgi:hypothetical protein
VEIEQAQTMVSLVEIVKLEGKALDRVVGEALGYTVRPDLPFTEAPTKYRTFFYLCDPQGNRIGGGEFERDTEAWAQLPDFHQSLDACALMEKHIATLGLEFEYIFHLSKIVTPQSGEWVFPLMTAGPVSRCRAALKALAWNNNDD